MGTISNGYAIMAMGTRRFVLVLDSWCP